MSFCSSCGSNLTAGSAFCNNCGQPVSSHATTSGSAAAAVQPAKAQEHRFFQDGDILVTNTRLVKGNETFAMTGITSVKSFVEVPSKKAPIIVIVVGVVIFLASLQSSIGAALFGAVIVAVGIWWYRSIKNIYHVRLVTASGERDAMSSNDGRYINSIVEAVNQAIVHRG